MEFEKLQKALAFQVRAAYKKENALSEKVIQAFFETPRHHFVSRLRNWGDDTWFEFNEKTAARFLPEIYHDQPLIIWGSEEDFDAKNKTNPVATISQPSLVLKMLDLLDLQKGQRVFELGTASGWNAALISHLVGPTGKVVTAEIIPQLAEEATKRIQNLGLKNIQVIAGDGVHGEATAPFDRVIFTAGAYDFPIALFDQTKKDGLALFVLKSKSGTDTLYLLRRHEDFFESIYSMPCVFAPLTGAVPLKELPENDLGRFLSSHQIAKTPVARASFWWGTSHKDHFLSQTSAIRGFLSFFKNFESFDFADQKKAFGWYEASSNSLAVAQAGELVFYGSTAAREGLIGQVKAWIDVGMPTTNVMNLRIYKSGTYIENLPRTWISKRTQSTFVWSLPSEGSAPNLDATL